MSDIDIKSFAPDCRQLLLLLRLLLLLLFLLLLSLQFARQAHTLFIPFTPRIVVVAFVVNALAYCCPLLAWLLLLLLLIIIIMLLLLQFEFILWSCLSLALTLTLVFQFDLLTFIAKKKVQWHKNTAQQCSSRNNNRKRNNNILCALSALPLPSLFDSPPHPIPHKHRRCPLLNLGDSFCPCMHNRDSTSVRALRESA